MGRWFAALLMSACPLAALRLAEVSASIGVFVLAPSRAQKQTIKEAMVRPIESADLVLESSGKAAIDKLAIAAEQRLRDSPQRLDEALKNASRFGDRIVSLARAMETTYVNETIIALVQGKICPLWPIC